MWFELNFRSRSRRGRGGSGAYNNAIMFLCQCNYSVLHTPSVLGLAGNLACERPIHWQGRGELRELCQLLRGSPLEPVCDVVQDLCLRLRAQQARVGKPADTLRKRRDQLAEVASRDDGWRRGRRRGSSWRRRWSRRWGWAGAGAAAVGAGAGAAAAAVGVGAGAGAALLPPLPAPPPAPFSGGPSSRQSSEIFAPKVLSSWLSRNMYHSLVLQIQPYHDHAKRKAHFQHQA